MAGPGEYVAVLRIFAGITDRYFFMHLSPWGYVGQVSVFGK